MYTKTKTGGSYENGVHCLNFRTKHEEDYAVFEGGEEEEEPDVLEELEMELNNKKKK